MRGGSSAGSNEDARRILLGSYPANSRLDTYLFQCCLVLYRAGNTMGSITLTLSLIRLSMYSLFQ